MTVLGSLTVNSQKVYTNRLPPIMITHSFPKELNCIVRYVEIRKTAVFTCDVSCTEIYVVTSKAILSEMGGKEIESQATSSIEFSLPEMAQWKKKGEH